MKNRIVAAFGVGAAIIIAGCGASQPDDSAATDSLVAGVKLPGYTTAASALSFTSGSVLLPVDSAAPKRIAVPLESEAGDLLQLTFSCGFAQAVSSDKAEFQLVKLNAAGNSFDVIQTVTDNPHPEPSKFNDLTAETGRYAVLMSPTKNAGQCILNVTGRRQGLSTAQVQQYGMSYKAARGDTAEFANSKFVLVIVSYVSGDAKQFYAHAPRMQGTPVLIYRWTAAGLTGYSIVTRLDSENAETNRFTEDGKWFARDGYRADDGDGNCRKCS